MIASSIPSSRAGPHGSARRTGTWASGDIGPWEELIARALAAPPPYHPVPGESVYHLRVDDQVVLVAEHDLSGPLYDLVTAVLAIGEAPHEPMTSRSVRALLADVSKSRGLGLCLPQEPSYLRASPGLPVHRHDRRTG